VKIGPVDPEIALLNLKKKINASKIYSPVGNLAEWAKKGKQSYKKQKKASDKVNKHTNNLQSGPKTD